MAEEAARIGRRMRERREELGLRQREVADRLPGNTEGKDISRWENGHHRPQGDTLELLASALETDVADLYAGPMAERKKRETPDPFSQNGQQSQLDRIEKRLEQNEQKLDLVLEFLEERAAIREESETVYDRGEDQPARRPAATRP